jgi:hypothetical protein
MKHINVLFVALGVMAGALLQGSGETSGWKLQNAKASVGDAKEDLKAEGSSFLEEWKTFKWESEQNIADNEKRIEAFKKKMTKVGPKMRAKYSKDVAPLEQLNQDLKKKLGDYKDEGETEWAEFKTNFKQDIDGLGKTMSALFKNCG